MRALLSLASAAALVATPIAIAPPAAAQAFGGGYGNIVRCESWQYRYNECRADTRGGVSLQLVIAGDCRRGNWGWRRGEIWVDNGCRAEFSTRYDSGAYYPDHDRDRGPSAGAIVGGVALAAGLAALIASSSKKKADAAPAPALPAHTGHETPAKVTADPGAVPTSARPSMNVCLSGAAAQVAASGGKEVELLEVLDIEKGSGGYRFRMKLKGVWPDESRDINAFCRATPTDLVELTFN